MAATSSSFFAVSGLRSTGRTTVYNHLKQSLPEIFPGREFAFLGNPFGRLHFPLTRPKSERQLDATTRLLRCWARLNEFCCKQLKPALEAGQVVVTDGFGLDGLLYSTACASEAETEDAVRLHHQLVRGRILPLSIQPPQYFIVRADHDKVDMWMACNPEVNKLDSVARQRFIVHQERMIEAYFNPATGQKATTLDTTELSREALAQVVAREIERTLKQPQAA
jgi:thymidylate kinase